MKFTGALVLLCGLLVNVSLKNVEALEGEGIIGGDNARLGDFPYHVSVRIMSQEVCGGAILDNYHVITAAHCVGDTKVGPYRLSLNVLAGLTDLKVKKTTDSGVVKINVKKIYVPRDYTRQEKRVFAHSDLAILKLESSLNLGSSENISSVKLAEAGKLYVNEEVTISGYGWNWVKMVENPFSGEQEEDGDTYGQLRYAHAKVYSHSQCQSKYVKKVKETHICAQVDQRKSDVSEGVCTGDSGGPLVLQGDKNENILVGVLSSSPIGCTEATKPAIYTRVTSFLDFIHKAVNDVDDPEIITTEPIVIPSRLYN